MTRQIGGVAYSEEAFEHMHRIALQRQLDGTLEPELKNEAEVIHAFHEHFPGVVMKKDADG